MTIRFTEEMTMQAQMMPFHEMDMNIRVLENFIEDRVEERSAMRSLSEIEEAANDHTISLNCLRFHEAVRQMKTEELSVREAKQWMICAVSAIRMTYDALRTESNNTSNTTV
jgi:hypothetical protein